MVAGSQIRSVLEWWQLAGADSFVSDIAVPWLAPQAAQAPPPPAKEAGAAPAAASGPLPATMDAYRRWILSPDALPELAGYDRRVAPRGADSPELVVMSDFPDDGPKADMLLDAMLMAIGMDAETVLISHLLPLRPANDRIDPILQDRATALARHLIALAGAKAVLLLGDAASRALAGSGVIEGRQSLQNIDLGSGTVPTIITFHPRFLLNKPAAKAQAWRDLQMLRSYLNA